jgi:hypothetical protein
MSEHAWFHDNLAGHGAGGLTAEERERFENHAAGCADCAQALADWRGLDGAMNQLFEDVRPAADLESRMIEALRIRPRRQWSVPRFAACAAAVVNYRRRTPCIHARTRCTVSGLELARGNGCYGVSRCLDGEDGSRRARLTPERQYHQLLSIRFGSYRPRFLKSGQ